MGERYRQFLGTRPGIVVELIDDSASPFRVKTDDGFEFRISAEDFKNYYKKEGAPTPSEWRHLVTDKNAGLVESPRMGEAMELVAGLEPFMTDFDRARAFARDAAGTIRAGDTSDLAGLRSVLNDKGWDTDTVTNEKLKALLSAPQDILEILANEASGTIHFLDAVVRRNGEGSPEPLDKPVPKKAPAEITTAPFRPGGMKNIELALDGDLLTIKVDLSQDLGPSKSGKSSLVASSQGSKKIPGRDERLGLTVYRQESKRQAKGRRNEFKNVVMSVDGDILTLKIDLSREHGPSKSGKTLIVASTEGNQLVYGREERIGLNVYRKLE